MITTHPKVASNSLSNYFSSNAYKTANNPAAASPKPEPTYCVKAAAGGATFDGVLELTPRVPRGFELVMTEEDEGCVELLGEVALGAVVGEVPGAQDALVGTVTPTVSQS